ncbi:LysR family transcriptional regulator [Streptomyces sp. ODS28]|uniref:LysR family transcriptional regulator n=1 Tax=Streptomyces sp. ODS28 TaxID=3136688 RepID=UPI0031ECCCC6
MSSPRNEKDTSVTPRAAGRERGGSGRSTARRNRAAQQPAPEPAAPGEWAAQLTPRLAQFVAVARHEHVTRAARELGVPQSTLSRALTRLETDLGVTLFARHGRTLSLTPAGRTFLTAAERALSAVEQAAESVRADTDPASGKVAFGFLHTLGWETVPSLLREFRAEHPRVRFSLVQNYGQAMLDKLRAGELDLCLTSPVPDAPDLVARRLDEQRLRLVVPDDHPLAARKRIRLAEAADESFVTLERGYGMRRILDDLCAQAGFKPRIAFEGEEAETARGLVAAGLGVALLPPPVITRPGVRELTVTAPRAVREIGLAWRAGQPETPPVAAFKQFLLGRRGKLLSF